MPKVLEAKLKKEYPGNPGAVYGTMNKLGYMKGSKETARVLLLSSFLLRQILL